jgi:hypothetical protein
MRTAITGTIALAALSARGDTNQYAGSNWALVDATKVMAAAAEITPVRSVDKIAVGKGKLGPVTKSLQAEFYGIVRGEKKDPHGWLTPVPVGTKQPVGV